MKRPSDDDGEAKRSSSPNSNIETFLADFFQRHPRFLLYFGVGLAALIIIAMIVAFATKGNR